MNRIATIVLVVYLIACVLGIAAPAPAAVTLKGTVTDPSGASVPNAVVVLEGPGGRQRATSNASGEYTFANVHPAKYKLRVRAKGFAEYLSDLDASAAATADVQLVIATEANVVTVEDNVNAVGTDAESNGTGLVLGKKELEALSDDPDELEQQLQAMAGPGAGPNGGQIYIDGFTGGTMPAKGSILQVKINTNPYAPEFDRPGFGRIEIITKPGADSLHGQAFVQYNGDVLDSRNPLLQQSSMPEYMQNFFGLTLGGPIVKNRASFTFDGERRNITENAFVYATTLDSSLNPLTISEGVPTPQTRTTITPRVDYSINSNNVLTARYQATRVSFDKEGIGDFNLPTMAYDVKTTEDTLQLTETAVISPKAVNEARFQFMRTSSRDAVGATSPTISVAGAFSEGGSPTGASKATNNRLELSDLFTYTHGAHTFKFGGRARQAFVNDTSLANFYGTFTFLGGFGPELDASNNPISGTNVQLSALEVYRRTLLFESMGLDAAAIRAGGGGATQFTLNSGTPTTSVSLFDVGLFFNDDWRIRPNLTVTYGLRYELQTHLSDKGDWSPRVSIAWGVDGRGTKPAKTVLRAGFGIFYDRLGDSTILAADRYNGITQQSYFVRNPDFYPSIPEVNQLSLTPQQSLQYIAHNAVAPRTYQGSIGVDRQMNKYFRVGAQWINSRGVHLLRTENINSPLNGAYPFGDSQVRLLTDTVGFSRSNMLVVSPNVNYKKLFLFGFYMSAWGKDDNEGLPANPYNLRAEWGPSSFADIRQRVVLGTSVPLPRGFSISPFIMMNSGTPYNITTGIDEYGTGYATARPALVGGVNAASCAGGSLRYAPEFGCFDLSPAPGAQTISRNFGRGPGTVMVNLRVAKTWSFGNKGESGPGMMAPPPGMGGARGGPSGPPPAGGGPGGPPPGMFGGIAGKRFNVTLSAMAQNVLNHPNYGAPSGDLSSPFFGESRTLVGFGPFGGGNRTYDRKVDLQLRFTF